MINEIISSMIIGIVQGVTELLPISSSGHLIISTELLGKEPSQQLLTFLHLASAIALLIIYFPTIKDKLKSEERNCFICNILIASIPVVIFGVFAGDMIEELLYSTRFVAYSLIGWGIVMVITEFVEKKLVRQPEGVLKKENAIIIGVGQLLSLIPGTSRSGISTMAGMWSGVEKSTSLDFAFMMGIPLLLGAFGFSFFSDIEQFAKEFDPYWLISFIFAFIFSYFAALLLRKISKQKFLTIFGVYRIFVGLIILIIFVL